MSHWSSLTNAPKFLVDRMLGRLAKWLVLLGFDAAFVSKKEEDDLTMSLRARDEGRILVTRDTRIPPVKGLRTVVLREQKFEEQLKRLVKETNLTIRPERLFSRCTECNAVVIEVPRKDALEEVPPKVRELETRFFRCPSCLKLYWEGTHVGHTIDKLKKWGLL